MELTFENIIDLFNKTAELRNIVTQFQTNPIAFATLKPSLKPAVEILVKQFEDNQSKEKFKKTLIEQVTTHYSKQVDDFFNDIDLLKNFIKE